MLMVWNPSGHALQQWEEKVNVKKKTRTWKKNKQINPLKQTDRPANVTSKLSMV